MNAIDYLNRRRISEGAVSQSLESYLTVTLCSAAAYEQILYAVADALGADSSKPADSGAALAAKLASDLRAMCVLFERGYGAPAQALAATVIEDAYLFAEIVHRPELAELWAAHHSYDHLPDELTQRKNRAAYFSRVTRGNFIDKKTADALYTICCMAKHSNAMHLPTEPITAPEQRFIQYSPVIAPETGKAVGVFIELLIHVIDDVMNSTVLFHTKLRQLRDPFLQARAELNAGLL